MIKSRIYQLGFCTCLMIILVIGLSSFYQNLKIPIYLIKDDGYVLLESFYQKDIGVTIDAGKRITVSPVRTDCELIRVHLVGDSMVFGWGLKDSETIASQLNESLGGCFEVVNHGVPGWGPYQYVKQLSLIPANEYVIVIHTAQNDYWDAINRKRIPSIRCNYLIEEQFDEGINCNVLDFIVKSGILSLMPKQFLSANALPIPFDKYSTIATSLLKRRIHKLYRRDTFNRKEKLLFTFVPWEHLYAKDNLVYFPSSYTEDNTPLFADDIDVKKHFSEVSVPSALFQQGDSHLSVKGAKLMANLLKKELIKRGQSVSN